MNKLLKLEQLGNFLLSIVLFSNLDYSWWVFPACILLPDLSMIGYCFNAKTGAYLYNIFHHKLLAVIIFSAGFYFEDSVLMLIGIILFGHCAMDRVLGYGLKYKDNFKHTHLGWIPTKQ
ncbi:DUF4260 domain-containing protein [Myroides sp. LJL116]